MGEKSDELKRKMQKSDREFWKAHHLCVRCHQKDAFTLNGRAECADCREKSRQRYRDWRLQGDLTQIRGIEAEYRNKFKQKRKEAELCTYCGKNPPVQGFSWCKYCQAKRSNWHKKRYVETNGGYIRDLLLADESICKRCFKQPRVPGKKLCEKCLAQTLEAGWRSNKKKGPGEHTLTHPELLERWNAEYGVDRYEDRASNKKQGAST